MAASVTRLHSIVFPPGYKEAKRRSRARRERSIEDDARKCLRRKDFQKVLDDLEPSIRRLVCELLECEDFLAASDVYERVSGLRYWEVRYDGTRVLLREWIDYFADSPHVLLLAPFDVQESLEYLRQDEVAIRARKALTRKRTFSSSNDDNSSDSDSEPPTKKVKAAPAANRPTARRPVTRRPAPVQPAPTQHAPALPAPALPAPNQPATSTQGSAQTQVAISGLSDDYMESRKHLWSRCCRRAWLSALNHPRSSLPAEAFQGTSHELDSHCTPSSADTRLCDYAVSIEEILTVSHANWKWLEPELIRSQYFPMHSLWREVTHRLSTWTAIQMVWFIVSIPGLQLAAR